MLLKSDLPKNVTDIGPVLSEEDTGSVLSNRGSGSYPSAWFHPLGGGGGDQ